MKYEAKMGRNGEAMTIERHRAIYTSKSLIINLFSLLMHNETMRINILTSALLLYYPELCTLSKVLLGI
jgi:hypothetical protein